MLFPRKLGKKRTERVWLRNNLSSKAEMICDDVRRRLAEDQQWQDKRFIPYPETYLNGERWEDEITPIKLTKSQEFSERLERVADKLQRTFDEKGDLSHGKPF